MILNVVMELAPSLALCLVIGLLLVFGKRHGISNHQGWPFILGGFVLLLIGSLLDLADHFESLRNSLIVGGLNGPGILGSAARYIVGPALLAVGCTYWLRRLSELDRSRRRLARHITDLESEVANRALGIEEANRERRESEERFRGVVENSPSAIFLKDLEGQFRLVNQRFEEWYGVAASEALGKTSHEIFPNGYADAYVAQDREVLSLGKVVGREQDIVFQDGSTHTILVTKFPVLDGTGTPLGIGTINTDLTEHKRVLTALRESEMALAEAQKVAKIGSWNWSIADDERVTCSEEFARLHGIELDDSHTLRKRQIEQAIHPDDRERVAKAHRRFADPALDYKIEYRIVSPDKKVRQVQKISKAVFDSGGQVLEYIGTVQDITEQKLIETALLAAKEEAELASRAKTEFLANMSHELRTPLNWIIGFSELIKNEMLGPIKENKYREYIDDIHTGGLHLLDLINDLLDLAQIESGNAKLHEEKVDVLEVVTSCIKLMAERADGAGVDLLLDIPTDERPILFADARMLKQILINLLTNGVKFTPTGGAVTTNCWLSSDADLMLQVRDTGIGIAPGDIPKALGRFQQVDGHLTRQHEGSGLGLALTKSFVELHGGTLDLQSSLGDGTSVTVRFPSERNLSLPSGNGAHAPTAAVAE